MCGITASIALPVGKLAAGQPGHQVNGSSYHDIQTQLESSVDILYHRGPDESGTWVSKDSSIALGHCRLSINDLSPSGSQPLVSDDGQIRAVVNGEIYDQDRLWKECREQHGYQFRGESDSELVVALYKIHGAPGLFKHLRGEFAFVLHDGREGQRRVIAARDRFGIKPLVWTVARGRLLVASEAKAFLPLGWKPEWDVAAIASAAWMLDERTLFKGVKKVLPGHWLEVTEEKGVQDHEYWDAEYEDKVGARAAVNPPVTSPGKAANETYRSKSRRDRSRRWLRASARGSSTPSASDCEPTCQSASTSQEESTPRLLPASSRTWPKRNM